MRKNGAFFISVMDTDQLIPSVWDPYSYRINTTEDCLGNYVAAMKINKRKRAAVTTPFRAIQYRDIPRGGRYLTFALEFSSEGSQASWPVVGEQQLLFGTMRAYLANVLVTPKARWLGLTSPLYFPVKSEFVLVVPEDNLAYFWWAYMQSPTFLANLPLGTGGTRPRLDVDAVEQTVVEVPDIHTRKTIHQRLEQLAEHEWNQYKQRQQLLDSLQSL